MKASPYSLFGRSSLCPAVAELTCRVQTYAGECKEYMVRYLKCMKQNKQQSTDCRHLSKEYLACRMDKCVPCVSLNLFRMH